jgi:uncharacterized protein (DUF1778 family)
MGTSQPPDWIELAKKAAKREGLTLSEFIGLAMVDRAHRVLKIDSGSGWRRLSERSARGRPKNG